MWFSVRHVLKNGPVYEERITIWKAQDFESAYELARAEAEDYKVNLHDATVLDLFQIYWLFDEPAQGAEVFSLIRESPLAAREYLQSFFDTGAELQSGTWSDLE